MAKANIDKINLLDYEANVKLSKGGYLYVETEDLLKDKKVRAQIKEFAEYDFATEKKRRK